MSKILRQFRMLLTGLPVAGVLMAVCYTASGQEKPKKCIDCHQKLHEKKHVHAPSEESCKNCHQSNGKEHPSEEEEEGFVLKQKIPQLCYECHDPQDNKKSVHKPVKGGNCTDCHEVHSSNEKKLVWSNTPDLCLFCHSDLQNRMDSLPVLHQVTKSGKYCLNCHNPHQSDNPRMLVARGKKLCLDCHNKKITTASRTLANISSELERNKFIHAPISESGCSDCHDPHVSENSSLLKGKFTSDTYVSARKKDNVGLCFLCHESGLLEKDSTTSATGFRNGQKNLHFRHVNKKKGRNCTNCHGVHSAPNPFLLLEKSRFGDWEMPLRFTKTETGGSCITACHAAKTYSRTIGR